MSVPSSTSCVHGFAFGYCPICHGFAFGYCPTCQGLTPPIVFDYTGQTPERYAKALAVVEATRSVVKPFSFMQRVEHWLEDGVDKGPIDEAWLCGACGAHWIGDEAHREGCWWLRLRAALAAFDEVEGS